MLIWRIIAYYEAQIIDVCGDFRNDDIKDTKSKQNGRIEYGIIFNQ